MLSHGDKSILTKHNQKCFINWRPTALLRGGRLLKRKIKRSHVYFREEIPFRRQQVEESKNDI